MNNTFLFNVEMFKIKRFDLITWKDAQTNRMVKLHPKQIEAFQYLTDDTTHFVGFGGAAFGGKSVVIVLFCLLSAFAYPETVYLIGRKEIINLQRTTLETLTKMFQAFEMKDEIHYHFSSMANIYKFPTGSKFILSKTIHTTIEDIQTRFGSLEITAACIDESNETTDTVIKEIYSRTGRMMNYNYNLCRKVLETFNPSKNHVYTRYWKPFSEKTLPNSYKFVRALPGDNPSPQAKDYVNGILSNGTEIQRQRLVYGNFEYDDNLLALVSYEHIQALYENDHVPISSEKYASADVALHGSDLFTFTVAEGKRVTKQIAFPKIGGKSLVAFLEKALKDFGIPQHNFIYDSDGIGGYLREFFPDAIPYNANSAPLPVNFTGKDTDRFATLKDQLNYHLAKLITEFEFMLDIPFDTGLNEELAACLILSDKGLEVKIKLISKDMIKRNIGRSPDKLDSLTLLQYFYLQPKRPKLIAGLA